MQAFRAILALLFMGGLIAACDDNQHRIYTNKSDCMNAAPGYNQACEDEHEN